MTIRTFLSGDEAAQVSIYNEAAAALPRFKAATLDEVRRRCRAADFDPTTRFFAVVNDQPVGYASFHANGRVAYPWCRPGHETLAEPLFEAVMAAMRSRGLQRAFAAYRGDWPAQRDFFLGHGFQLAREMVNFVVDLADLPTPGGPPGNPVTPLQAGDLANLLALGSGVVRSTSVAELERHLFRNPHFTPDALVVLRSRQDNSLLAAGILIENSAYADPQQVDSGMPCFRLGAFGTEGMQTKRISGLFSFLARPGRDFTALALDMLRHVMFRVQNVDLDTLAAQVPADVPHLLRFYQQYFRRQGSFPVFERELGAP